MTMVVTYFDTLSSGMKARLDPNFRLSTRREQVYTTYPPQKEVDSTRPNRTWRSIIRPSSSK